MRCVLALGPRVGDGRLVLEQQPREAAEAVAHARSDAAAAAAAADGDGALEDIPHENCRRRGALA